MTNPLVGMTKNMSTVCVPYLVRIRVKLNEWCVFVRMKVVSENSQSCVVQEERMYAS